MSNDIRTRRLIVNLPDVSGEEADEVAARLEDDAYLPNGVTVTHALGETLPEGIVARQRTTGTIALGTTAGDAYHYLTPHEARQLAGVLLALAHDIDPSQEA